MGVSLIGLIAIVAIIVLAAVAYLFSRIVVVPSNLTGLISGSNRGTVKIVHPGGRDFVLPVIQTIQYLPFTQTTIGFKVTAEDENKINVNVAAVAAVKVGDSDEQVRAAAKRFLGKPNTDQAIADSAREALIGSLRSIIGHMTVTDLISDRDALQRNVFDDAKSIMANMGLEIDMLQVSEITDAGGYIESLGVPEQQRVEKDARIARANAEREARDAEVTSRQQIAERERDLSLRQAQLKAETDKAQADADSAGPIARAAKEREIAIIGQEAAEAKAALTERELDSTVRKPADAARYQREQEAQASKTEALLRAQADAERTRLDAEAQAQADSPAVAKADLAPAAPLAGSGRDPSDCLPSAGQTWSKLRKACVQVFDVADIRLTDPDNPALAVYVLFSPDKKVAEMFSASFPDGSVMMAATRGGNSYFANMGRVLLLKDSQSKEGWRIAK